MDNPLSLIKKRPENSHKGVFGTLVNISGSKNMPGALYLSSMGALRSGVGLLKIATLPETFETISHEIYEAVYIDLNDLLKTNADAYLIGCGAGRKYDGIFEKILTEINGKTVIDADCINFLAANINILKKVRGEKIITPHPAEMSRLTGLDIDFIQKNRIECAVNFAKAHNCTLILKGQNTVIAFSDGTHRINTSGNSGLAKGGSGDVLAGIIAGLCAQGYDCREAAVLGTYVHGLAADRLIQRYGKHGMLPRDICGEAGIILG